MLSAPVCSGYSGCKITISNGRVIKSTNGSYPIGRLVKQANKQKKFAAMKYDGVLIPEVLSCESDSKDCHITMEYFSCLNVIEYLNRASKGDLDKISKTVCSFVESNINSSEMVELDKGVIVDKFESVINKIPAASSVRVPFEEILNKQLQEKIKIPIGPCHGDLTFSNILFSTNSNDIVLIDFLDSFLESPIMDIVKLRQDTRHGWSAFIYERDFDRVKIDLSLEYLDRKIVKQFKDYNFYSYYDLFEFVNLIRIFPYATGKKTRDFLMRKICST